MKILKNPSLYALPHAQYRADWIAFVCSGGYFIMPKYYTTKNCLNCLKPVPRNRHNLSEYCGINCKKSFEGDSYIDPAKPVVCKGCDTLFYTDYHNKEYCSNKCRLDQLKVSDFSIFKRDNFTCIYCGKSSIEDGVKLAIDHVHPFSKEGKTERSNLITSCVKCNSSKGSDFLNKPTEQRVLECISNRNNSLSPKESSDINKEIAILKSRDFIRMKRNKGEY